MLKKFKRYLDNLSSKETERIIFIFCFITGLLILLFITLNRNNFSYDLPVFLFIALSSTVFIAISIGCLLYLVLNVDGKKLDEEIRIEKTEFESMFSDTAAKLILSKSTNHFPKDIVLFYLEQKGAQFWIEVENCEESDGINAKIYISDNDNPEEKFVYPVTITNPLYVKSHFKIEN